jgi:3-hydroxy-3-methylglutaryl CoA synthase
MSVGISSVGVYLPDYRMKRELMARAWERRPLKGERTVANTDEDSLTMAVEAARSALTGPEGAGREGLEALYFASLTAPYAEKSQAGLLAAVCDLPEEIMTADLAQCARAGVSGLLAALGAVNGALARRALVSAADTRLAYPKSDQEQLLGDAGAAVLVSGDQVAAEFEAAFSVNTEIIDTWRNYGEKCLNVGEGRFILEKGYLAAMGRAVKGLLAKTGLGPGRIDRLVLSSPGLRENQQLAGKLGFSEEQLQDSLMLQVGDCGTAQPLLLLAAALETAEPGDRILLAAYGQGADALMFKATDEVLKIRRAARLRRALANKRYLESYSRYLSFRGLLETVPGEPFRTFPSNAAYWRDQKGILRFHGSRCLVCGTGIFPVNRVCFKCGAKDRYEEVPLSDRRAKVFTYSVDHLAGRGDDPVVVQTVAEDEEGFRYYLLMTDFEPAEVQVGREVEFTFRKIYEGGRYINYFWKCRPARKEGEA